MKDRHGNGLVVGCYVRAHPRAPRAPYKGWITAVGEASVVVENDRGHTEAFTPQGVEVLKPSLKAKFARERAKTLAHAVSVAAHRNLRK